MTLEIGPMSDYTWDKIYDGYLLNPLNYLCFGTLIGHLPHSGYSFIASCTISPYLHCIHWHMYDHTWLVDIGWIIIGCVRVRLHLWPTSWTLLVSWNSLHCVPGCVWARLHLWLTSRAVLIPWYLLHCVSGVHRLSSTCCWFRGQCSRRDTCWHSSNINCNTRAPRALVVH